MFGLLTGRVGKVGVASNKGHASSIGLPYTGPGDIVSGPTAWYGLRAYNAAVAATGTQKAINIRRTSDSTTADILILPNGKLDVATATAFLAATTGFVTTWYDQSGNLRDQVQGTQAAQPQLLLTGANGLPTIQFSGAQSLARTPSPTVPQPFMFVAVSERTGAFTVQNAIFGHGSSQPLLAFGAANRVFMQGGATTGLGIIAPDSVLHSLFALASGSSSAITVDGVTSGAGLTGTDTGGLNTANPLWIGQVLAGSVWPLNGYVSEAAVWPIGLSGAQIASMQANQKAYWGTP